MTFVEVPPVDLAWLLPNLPPIGTGREREDTLDLVKKLLAYEPEWRLRAVDALKDPFFTHGAPLLLPQCVRDEAGDGHRLANVISHYLSSVG